MDNALWYWVEATLGDARGVVVLVHGLGEHSKRYDELVAWLTLHEYAVLAYDHYGHGRSPGERGTITSDTQLVDDLQGMVALARQKFPDVPVYLLGHSMGGVVALDYALRHPDELAGVIALSPALDLGLNAMKRVMLQGMLRLAPDKTVDNGLPARAVSHDPEVAAAYQQDDLVHRQISARLAHYIDSAGKRIRVQAANWPVPTLLLYAGADQLVNPQGSADFAAVAPVRMVRAQCFGGAYHELHHEPDTGAFYQALQNWLPNKKRTAT